MQHLQTNLQSRAAMGDSVLETVAAIGAVVDRLYKVTSRLGYYRVSFLTGHPKNFRVWNIFRVLNWSPFPFMIIKGKGDQFEMLQNITIFPYSKIFRVTSQKRHPVLGSRVQHA